jgi:hypothetical protein
MPIAIITIREVFGSCGERQASIGHHQQECDKQLGSRDMDVDTGSILGRLERARVIKTHEKSVVCRGKTARANKSRSAVS